LIKDVEWERHRKTDRCETPREKERERVGKHRLSTVDAGERERERERENDELLQLWILITNERVSPTINPANLCTPSLVKKCD
jgi:hypothetical protein